jgi:hypothetical protein
MEERLVIALMYFEDMSFREAAGALEWSTSKTVRRQRSALNSLRDFLGVEDSDQLQLDVGALALLSVGGASSFPQPRGGVLALPEKAANLAANAWLRGHDLARRFIGGGGDAAGALASGGAGRAAGVCATAVALACLAGSSTVVGPLSQGGVDLGNSAASHSSDRPDGLQPAHNISEPSELAVQVAPSTGPDDGAQKDRADRRSLKRRPALTDPLPATPNQQAETEFRLDAGGAGTPVTPAPPPPRSDQQAAASPEAGTPPATSSERPKSGSEFGL